SLRSRSRSPDRRVHDGPIWVFSFAGIRKEGEDLLLKEGRIHAELQREAPTEAVPELVDQLAQESDGPAAVVDIPGPVLQPQDVAGLGQMGQQGVVTRVLLEVGV